MKYCLKCGVNYSEVIQQGREYCSNSENHYGTYIPLLEWECERIDHQGAVGSVVDARVVKATFNRGLEEPDLLIQWDDDIPGGWISAACVTSEKNKTKISGGFIK